MEPLLLTVLTEANGVFDIGDSSSYWLNINRFLVAAGTSDMAISPSTNSKQNCITAKVLQNANTLLNLQNSKGEILFTFSPAVNYGYVVFSSPELVKGTYSFYYCGSVSRGTKEDGLYSNKTYTAIHSNFSPGPSRQQYIIKGTSKQKTQSCAVGKSITGCFSMVNLAFLSVLTYLNCITF